MLKTKFFAVLSSQKGQVLQRSSQMLSVLVGTLVCFTIVGRFKTELRLSYYSYQGGYFQEPFIVPFACVSKYFILQQGETGANILVGLQIEKSEMGEFHERARRVGYEYIVVTDDGAFQLLMRSQRPEILNP